MNFTTLLVANRGEIARRIIRTAHSMGIRCVAVFVDADAVAPFVSDADLEKIISDGKGKMPAYKTKLSVADVSSLVAFIRGLAKH